jgi:hypothetical protein
MLYANPITTNLMYYRKLYRGFVVTIIETCFVIMTIWLLILVLTVGNHLISSVIHLEKITSYISTMLDQACMVLLAEPLHPVAGYRNETKTNLELATVAVTEMTIQMNELISRSNLTRDTQYLLHNFYHISEHVMNVFHE